MKHSEIPVSHFNGSYTHGGHFPLISRSMCEAQTPLLTEHCRPAVIRVWKSYNTSEQTDQFNSTASLSISWGFKLRISSLLLITFSLSSVSTAEADRRRFLRPGVEPADRRPEGHRGTPAVRGPHRGHGRCGGLHVRGAHGGVRGNPERTAEEGRREGWMEWRTSGNRWSICRCFVWSWAEKGFCGWILARLRSLPFPLPRGKCCVSL